MKKVNSLSDTMFDSTLSILFRRNVRALCKSILVAYDEGFGNATEKNSVFEVIE